MQCKFTANVGIEFIQKGYIFVLFWQIVNQNDENLIKHKSKIKYLTLVLLRVFPKQIFRRGVVAIPRIINTEGHINLNYTGMDTLFPLIPK